MNRPAAERRGRRAETLAAWLLRLKGYRVLARRVRVHGGEIDIVARRGNIISFVEVKARADEMGADAALAPHRLARVRRAADALWPRYAGNAEGGRIDAVVFIRGRWPRHIKGLD